MAVSVLCATHVAKQASDASNLARFVALLIAVILKDVAAVLLIAVILKDVCNSLYIHAYVRIEVSDCA